jgi:hypothetical protein
MLWGLLALVGAAAVELAEAKVAVGDERLNVVGSTL